MNNVYSTPTNKIAKKFKKHCQKKRVTRHVFIVLSQIVSCLIEQEIEHKYLYIKIKMSHSTLKRWTNSSEFRMYYQVKDVEETNL